MAIKGFVDGAVCCYVLTSHPLLKLPDLFVQDVRSGESVCSFMDRVLTVVSVGEVSQKVMGFPRSCTCSIGGLVGCVNERGVSVFG